MTDLPLSAAAFGFPERVAPSAWVEHVPFLMWLIAALRPARFVELGTHNGMSYCAACQSAAEHGTGTVCFAVDTWQGDEHAGHYGEEVLADLAAWHNDRYSGFSTLLRSTFDEAVRHFDDGTLPLLHIDGLHTYEAVRHDFETWAPKLTPDAVVLFHDTNVHERDFGVFRFWAEVSAGRTAFEFAHGHGLGVLCMGTPPAALAPLFDPARAVDYRRIFSHLGRAVTLHCDAVAGRAAERAENIFQSGRVTRALEQALGVGDPRIETLLREAEIAQLGTRTDANPQDVAALGKQANLLIRQDRFDEALVAIEQALALEPARAGFHGMRGGILARLGRVPEAIAATERALELAPDHEAFAKRLQALKKRG